MCWSFLKIFKGIYACPPEDLYMDKFVLGA